RDEEPRPPGRGHRRRSAAGRLRAHRGRLGEFRRRQHHLRGGLAARPRGLARGRRESGTAFALPTYAFIAGVFALIAIGIARLGAGHHLSAQSAHWGVKATSSYGGIVLVFLLLRAFASGCTALTGVEAISNGVPNFQKPKSKNAATTLALLGGIAVSMFLAITAFAIVSHVHTSTSPTDLGLSKSAHLPTVIAQVGAAVFGGYHALGFYYLQAVTALILMLA